MESRARLNRTNARRNARSVELDRSGRSDGYNEWYASSSLFLFSRKTTQGASGRSELCFISRLRFDRDQRVSRC